MPDWKCTCSLLLKCSWIKSNMVIRLMSNPWIVGSTQWGVFTFWVHQSTNMNAHRHTAEHQCSYVQHECVCMLVLSMNDFPARRVSYWVNGGFILCGFSERETGGHQELVGGMYTSHKYTSPPSMCPSLCSSLCHPGIQSHSLDVCPILFLRLSWRGPQQDHGGLLCSGCRLVVEVLPPASTLGTIVPVAALIGGAVAAEAVDGRAALGAREGDGHQTLSLDLKPCAHRWTAGATGGAAVTVWGDGFWFDVDIGVCVDCECGALRYGANWPGGKNKNKRKWRCHSKWLHTRVKVRL